MEWSDEDKCFIGTCPGLFLGGCDGNDEAKVYKHLCEIVEDVIEDMLKNGEALPEETINKTYSRKFAVRVSPAVHKKIAIKALVNHRSLNKYVGDLPAAV